MKSNAIEARTEATEPLPALFGRMGDELTQLFDTKLSLLKIELREEMEAYIRGLAMIMIGAVVALVGFAILNVAIAFLVSVLFENTGLSQPARYGLGFAITALVYLVLGGVLIVIYKNKLGSQALVPPRTVAELKRDKERLEQEI